MDPTAGGMRRESQSAPMQRGRTPNWKEKQNEQRKCNPAPCTYFPHHIRRRRHCGHLPQVRAQRLEYSERERAAAQAEEARKRRLHRKQLRDFKVFCLGIAATCCGIIAFGVWYAGLRPLAFFPAPRK